MVSATLSARSNKLIKRSKRPRSPSQPPPSCDALLTVQQDETNVPSDMPPFSLSEPNFLLRSRSLSASKVDGGVYGSSSKDFRASSSSLWPSRWRLALRPSSKSSSQATIATGGGQEGDDDSALDFVLSPGWELLPQIPHVSPLEIQFNDRGHTHGLQPTTECVVDDARQEPNQTPSIAVQGRQRASTGAAAAPQPRMRTKHKFTLHLDDELDFEGTAEDTRHSCHFHLPSRLGFNIAPSQVSPPMSSANEAPASPVSPVRPGLTRRPAAFGPQPGVSRRYTFAMAMTDEGITDEALVRELERIRAVRTLSLGSPSRTDSHTNLPTTLSANIPENNVDIGDVWDTDGGHSDAEVELGESGRGQGEQNNELFAGGTTIYDSPSSEGYTNWSSDPATSLQSPPAIPPPRSSSIPAHGRSSLDSGNHPSPPKQQPAATWLTTRHALLTCRELVRTERHYLSSLISLLSCETSSPPPPLMLHYTAVLVGASAMLLERMERSPTPSGVSKAFAASESELETAYVGWCGVVGSWFVDGDQNKGMLIPEKTVADKGRASLRRLSKGRTSNVEEPPIPRKPVSSWKAGFDTIVATSTVTATRSRSTVSTASGTSSSSVSSSSHSHSSSGSSSHSTTTTSPSSSVSGCSPRTQATSVSTTPAPSTSASKSSTPSIAPPPSANPSQRPTLSRKGQAASAPPSRVPSFSDVFNLEEVTRLYSTPVTTDKASRPARKPSIRDLAILPTQRIMRYVLLFKDLESSTPYSSSSRSAVERAAGIADRMAKKCDRAQNNAAFIVSPSPSNSNQNPTDSSPSMPLPATPVVGPSIPRPPASIRPVESSNASASPPVVASEPTIEEGSISKPKSKGKEKEKTRSLPRKLTKRSRAPLSVHTKHGTDLAYQQGDIEVFSPSDTVSIYTSSEHGHGSTSSHIPPPLSGSRPPSTYPLSDDEPSRRWRSQSHTNVSATLRASRRTSMVNWTNAFSSMWSNNTSRTSLPPSAFSAMDLVASASSSK